MAFKLIQNQIRDFCNSVEWKFEATYSPLLGAWAARFWNPDGRIICQTVEENYMKCLAQALKGGKQAWAMADAQKMQRAQMEAEARRSDKGEED